MCEPGEVAVRAVCSDLMWIQSSQVRLAVCRVGKAH